MLNSEEVMQLIGSLVWLLAGVGVFIVGMNFMGDALEKSAGTGIKRMLEKIKAHQKSRRINFSFLKAASSLSERPSNAKRITSFYLN